MEKIINIIQDLTERKRTGSQLKADEWKSLFNYHNQLIDDNKLNAVPQHRLNCGGCKAVVQSNLYDYFNNNNFMAKKNRTPKETTKETAQAAETQTKASAEETKRTATSEKGTEKTVLSILIAGTEAQVDKLKSSIKKVEGVEIRTSHAGESQTERMKTLLERAEGEFVVFVEPTATVPESYAELIMQAIEANPKAEVLAVKSRIGQQVYLHSPEHKKAGRIRDRIVGAITLQNPIRKELISELDFENIESGLLNIQSGLKSFQIEKPLYLRK